MSIVPRILAFAGSLRAGSYNKKLLTIAITGARDAGADVTQIDLRDFPLPLYDGDLESASGLPENAQKLQALFLSNHGLLMAVPEYNTSFPAVWKNTIDWVSRPIPDHPPLAAFRGKVAAIMSASPGRFGGVRSLQHVRQVLANTEVLVIPESVSLSLAGKAFAEDGSLLDAKFADSVRKLGAKLVDTLKRLTG